MEKTAQASREDLIKQLVDLQNDGNNEHQDILTITMFMDDAELAQHVARYADRSARKAA